MRHISGALAEVMDDLAKRVEHPSHPERQSVRRISRGDLEAQALYFELKDLSDANAVEIDRLTRRKAVIDQIRGAIALGHSSGESVK